MTSGPFACDRYGAAHHRVVGPEAVRRDRADGTVRIRPAYGATPRAARARQCPAAAAANRPSASSLPQGYAPSSA
ncbi:hypothetical protein FHX80_113760 [Streptomyces brevispora]|uniref:Uncharacterized protein n=1 Tax=Streptomyces brevispora TaxID=887462 RepID=A0A561V151_9ACTN|nr:hypothetical protein FHX80_113760 [Streptomyces brevispora]